MGLPNSIGTYTSIRWLYLTLLKRNASVIKQTHSLFVSLSKCIRAPDITQQRRVTKSFLYEQNSDFQVFLLLQSFIYPSTLGVDTVS